MFSPPHSLPATLKIPLPRCNCYSPRCLFTSKKILITAGLGLPGLNSEAAGQQLRSFTSSYSHPKEVCVNGHQGTRSEGLHKPGKRRTQSLGPWQQLGRSVHLESGPRLGSQAPGQLKDSKAALFPWLDTELTTGKLCSTRGAR